MKPDSTELEAQRWLETLTDEVRQAVAGGDSYVAEQFITQLGDEPDVEQVMDLIYAEIDARETAGQHPRCEEYVERFPQWRSRLHRLFEVHEAMASQPLVDVDAPTARDATWTGEDLGILRPDRLGQYEILDEIGSGATGVVYRARQDGLNRCVAVKILRPFGTPLAATRFQREAELTARLDHPNIVRIFEVGTDRGCHYMSMEWIEGGSLSGRLRRAAFEPKQAAELVMILADAMAAAHDEGIIHRDLKPANVLLTTDGSPRITDFGLARHLSDGEPRQTKTGVILGTPGYMAPEQTRIEQAGREADIYALGAVLYELLTGRPPYHGTSIVEILEQMRAADPTPVCQLRPGVPRDLQTICTKCLEREPHQRYATARDLHDELQRHLEGRPITARPVGRLEHLYRWARRHKTVSMLGALCVLTILVGTTGVVWQWLRAEDGLARSQRAQQDERQQRLLAEDRLYRRHVLAANREVEAGALSLAVRILDECGENRRGWEWRYLRSQAVTPNDRFAGHTSALSALVVSPDGRFVAGTSGLYVHAAGRKTIVWDATTGSELWSYSANNQGLRLAFSPDSRMLLIAGHGDATVHETATGGLIRKIATSYERSAWGAAFSPDGRQIAYPNNKTVWLSGAETDEAPTIRFSGLDASGGVHSIHFHPTRPLVAVATRSMGVTLHDRDSGELLEKLSMSADTRRVRFSPDGRLLVAAGYSRWVQGHIQIWEEGEDGYEPLHSRFDREGPRTGFTFSPDGQCLAVWTGSSPVRLMNPSDFREFGVYPAHQFQVDVAFSPDSRTLYTTGREGTIRAWDRSEELRLALGRSDNAYATDFAVHPNGRFVTLVCDVNPNRGNQSYGNTPQIVDLERWRRVRTLKGHTAAVTEVDYDVSGRWIATGSSDRTVRVWDAETGRNVSVLRDFRRPISGVYFMPSGELLSVDQGGTVLVSAGPEFKPGQQWETGLSDVTHSSLSGDWLALADASGRSLLLDLSAGTRIRIPGDGVPLRCISLNASADRVCMALENGQVSCYSLADGQATRLWHVPAHDGVVHSVAFHPNEDRIVSTGADGLIRVMAGSTGSELLSLRTRTYSGPVFRAKFDGTTDRLLATTRTWLFRWDGKSGDSSGSVDSFDEAGANWHRYMARDCEDRENWSGAASHWESVATLDPDDGQCHLFAARCCRRNGDPHGAERACMAALRVVEDHSAERDQWAEFHSKVCNELAGLLIEEPSLSADSAQRAVRLATRAVSIQPRNAEYLKTLSRAVLNAAANGQD